MSNLYCKHFDADIKDVNEYINLYKVCSYGCIISLPKRTSKKIFSLSPSKNNSGYNCVSLCKNGLHKTHTVHSIVAYSFLSPRPNGMDIDHIDGNKLNNKSSNLRYVSRKTNMQNAVRNGFNNKGEKSKFSKLSRSSVMYIRSSKESQKHLAKAHDVSVATISRILNRKTWYDLS